MITTNVIINKHDQQQTWSSTNMITTNIVTQPMWWISSNKVIQSGPPNHQVVRSHGAHQPVLGKWASNNKAIQSGSLIKRKYANQTCHQPTSSPTTVIINQNEANKYGRWESSKATRLFKVNPPNHQVVQTMSPTSVRKENIKQRSYSKWITKLPSCSKGTKLKLWTHNPQTFLPWGQKSKTSPTKLWHPPNFGNPLD